jgi:hypothetical protein
MTRRLLYRDALVPQRKNDGLFAADRLRAKSAIAEERSGSASGSRRRSPRDIDTRARSRRERPGL